MPTVQLLRTVPSILRTIPCRSRSSLRPCRWTHGSLQNQLRALATASDYPKYLKSKPPVTPDFGPNADVPAIVKGVIDDIRSNGDSAVKKYSKQFDKWDPSAGFKLTPEGIQDIVSKVDPQILSDIKEVQANVRKFAEAQKASLKDFEIEMEPGVFLGQRNIPIRSVGTYIPGGRYPLLASAHMTVLTAKVAGVPNVVACTPPIAGEIPTSTVAAMHLAGADHIYLLGGVQAVAAMALGTESIDVCDFIAGPGNAFVAEAKKQLFGSIGIDLLAGPTEVLIVADEHADPFMVATDLLSQAEHGPDTPAVLITNSEEVGRKTIEAVDKLLPILPTRELAGTSWKNFGEVIVVRDLDEGYRLADQYASEHVQILTERPREALDKMKNYGSIFLGANTCVSYGDKVSIPGTVRLLDTKLTGRIVYWYKPCLAHSESCEVHWRVVGRQVYEDGHLSGSNECRGEWTVRKALWAVGES